MQGCCARNKHEVTTTTIAINVLLCAVPITLTWIGGGLLAWSGSPFGHSIEGFTQTVVDQVRTLRSQNNPNITM